MFDAYIRAVKENGKLIFPEDFCITPETPEDYDKKSLEEIESTLGPYLYAGNYYNNPVSDDLVEFKEEWFQIFRFDQVAEKLRGAKCIISVDPATKDKQENDPSGIIITKVADDGAVYVINATAKKMRPPQLVDEVFSFVEMYAPDIVVFETISAQILWMDLFKYEMKKREVYFRLEEYNPGTKATKPIKIRKLIPYYARGQMFHKQGLTELEKQLREFPRNKNDDLIDALQAQIPYWKGKTTIVRKPLVKYSVEWWDELRKRNHDSRSSAEEELFKEYRHRRPVTLREPRW